MDYKKWAYRFEIAFLVLLLPSLYFGMPVAVICMACFLLGILCGIIVVARGDDR